jgi:hypothetical protein
VGETRQTSSRLFAAIRQVQADQLRLDDGHERARARARLLQSVEGSAAQASRTPARPVSAMPWRWVMGGLVSAACAVAVIVSLPGEQLGDGEIVDSAHALAYVVDGSELAPGQAIVADETARVLDFDDGTHVELASAGELRVTDLRSNGAMV